MDQQPTDLIQTIIFGSLVVFILTISLIFTILYQKRKTNILPLRFKEQPYLPLKIFKILSIELENSTHYSELISQLENRYDLLKSKHFESAKTLIRQFPVDFILIALATHLKKYVHELSYFNEQFPAVPVIIYQSGNGKTDHQDSQYFYVHEGVSADQFEKYLAKNIIDKVYRVNYRSYGIELEDCSPIIQKVLKVLEEKSATISGVWDLSKELDVSREFLSREFGAQCQMNLKNLITLLKLHQAIFLMQNPGLNLNEISSISGFADAGNFRRAFQKYFHSTPKEYRKNLLQKRGQT